MLEIKMQKKLKKKKKRTKKKTRQDLGTIGDMKSERKT